MDFMASVRDFLFALPSLILVLCFSASSTLFAAAANPNPPLTPVKLVFIHHSTGEAWLNDEHGRLGVTLRDNNYFVSDTNYGWGPADRDSGGGTIGDHTDIGHWYNWFSGPNRDTYLNALYSENGQNCSYSRLSAEPTGSNQVIMFKSCFPNSQLRGSPGDAIPPITSNPLRGEAAESDAHTIANAKGIYIELLTYFAARQDKLFVVIAAPPLVRGATDASAAANARTFNNWLVNDWLKNYAHPNVFVFDFYNVLTSNGGPSRTDNPNVNDLGFTDGNHHRWYGGAIQHLQSLNNDYSAYASSTDDSHPTAAGGIKASGEFAALLNIAYNQWRSASGTCSLSCSATVPASAATATSLAFAGTATASGCAGSIAFDWDFGDGSPHSSEQNASHSYGNPGTFVWTMTAAVSGVTCSKTGSVAVVSAETGCPHAPAVAGQTVYQVPQMPEPPARVSFKDPVFGTCLVRVTDRNVDLDPGDASAGLKNEYSRVQSFNSDETRILVRGIAATWYLYDAYTLRPLRLLPFSGPVDPRWDAADPYIIYYLEETRLMRCDIRTGELTLVHDFAGDFPGQSLVAVWTRYEGSPSLDGRYWGLMAHTADSTGEWHVVAFLVYDLQTGQVIAKRDMRGVQGVDLVDSVSISPLGNYFVAYFDACEAGTLGTDAKPCGFMVYGRDLTGGRGLHRIMGHSDLALDAQGREVLVFQDNDTDHLAMLDLTSATVTNLWAIDFSSGALGFHLSGRANLLPGWALVSTTAENRTSSTWMDNQVFAMELRASGRVFRLAHTHSVVDPAQEHDYWAEPQASTNRDMTRILFTTNWGRSGTEQVEMYLIELPANWASDKPPAATLVFPRLVTDSGAASGPDRSEYTGLALANLGTGSAVLNLAAYDATGKLIAGSDIANPRSIGLSAGQQLALLDYQVFGGGLPARKPVGWISVTSTISQVVGFFLMFNGSLTTLDGADVSSATSSSLILPEIGDQGTTQIHVANPNGQPAKITLQIYDADGKPKGTAAERSLGARGAVAEYLTALFPAASPAASDHIRVTSDKPVLGFESLGVAGQYCHGMNGQDTAGGSTVLYAPQYVVGSAWRSTLSVVNLEATDATVTMRLIRDDGTPIGTTKQAQIKARGKIHITDQSYFVDPGSAQIQGYVEISSSGPRLAGSVVFGDPGRSQFSAALPLVSTPRTSMIFSQVASDSTYFTGLAILNTSSAAATVTIEVLDRSGTRIAYWTGQIPAGNRTSRLLTQFFPELVGRNISSGYIRVASDRSVASFALFGTSNLSVLAAVPPQAVP